MDAVNATLGRTVLMSAMGIILKRGHSMALLRVDRSKIILYLDEYSFGTEDTGP